MATKKAKKEELKLEYERKNGWTLATDKEKKAIFDFADKYMKFLDAAKTEREAVKTTVKMLEKEGFVDINAKKSLSAGDKVYFVNKAENRITRISVRSPLLRSRCCASLP